MWSVSGVQDLILLDVAVSCRTLSDGSHGEKDILSQLLMLHPAHKAVSNLKSLLKTSEVFLPQEISI